MRRPVESKTLWPVLAKLLGIDKDERMTKCSVTLCAGDAVTVELTRFVTTDSDADPSQVTTLYNLCEVETAPCQP